MKIKNLLIKLEACREAIEWVGDKDLKEAWETCHRGDWMLWLAAMTKVDHRTLTLAKGRCAKTVVHLMKDELIINAVKAAIDYGNGRITYKELDNAADAAYAAHAAYTTTDHAAAHAAYTAAANTAATYANAAAAYAAAANAAAANAADDARVKNQKATADICREILTEEVFNKYNNL